MGTITLGWKVFSLVVLVFALGLEIGAVIVLHWARAQIKSLRQNFEKIETELKRIKADWLR